MEGAYLQINKALNYLLLRFIRVFNLVLLISLFVYFGDLFTGLPIQNIITGFVIFWAALIGLEHDIVSTTTKKVMHLDWGFSLLLLFGLMTIFWQNRTETLNTIKTLIIKICSKQ